MESIGLNAEVGNATSKVRPFSSEWLISFKDPRVLWEEHWFALVVEIVNAVILFQLLRHAKRRGNEAFYAIITAIFSVICFEILPLMPREGYQLWWYHQGMVNILTQRVPSFVVTSFAIVHYVAHNLMKNCNLPTYTRSLVTAVAAILMYFPYLWLASRLLLIVTHFDDVMFRDRLLGVPYLQILIVFLLFYHASQIFQQNYDDIEPQDRNSYNYIWCSVVSGLVSACYTIVEQYLLYLVVTLLLKQKVAFCCLVALGIMLSLAKDEIKLLQVKSYSIAGISKPLRNKIFWAAVTMLLFASTLPLWLNVRDLRSSGNRMELGPCHITHDVSNTSPLEITRRRYVCPDDALHMNFDFHCVNQAALRFGIQNNVNHYTICGKAFDNTLQVVKLMTAYSIICLFIFYNLMRFSFTCKQEKVQNSCSTKVQ